MPARRTLLSSVSAILLFAGGTQAAPPLAGESFNCVIEAKQTVKLASSALGMVAELRVDRGDIVHKGEVLGKLDDSVEAANLALAKAKAENGFDVVAHQSRLSWLRTKFARDEELSATRVVSRNTRDEAKSDMEVEEQQLRVAQLQRAVAVLEARQAEAALAQRSFVSPIDGVVVERLLSVGEYRNDQSAVLTLAQIDPLRVEVFVPTAFYRQVQVGSVGYVRPEDPFGQERSATVTVVDKVLDAASGTFGVRLSLPNPNLTLPAGLKCKIRFLAAPVRATDRPGR